MKNPTSTAFSGLQYQIILFITLILSGNVSVKAQKPSKSYESIKHKWEISLTNGFVFLGPAHEIKNSMVESGLGDDYPGGAGFLGGRKYKKYPKASLALCSELKLKKYINETF